ncbi:hypothetical protein [Fusibacter sp. JL216-2]|uniref:hypothetical protein n=1 Tax=Fusibacter sp. JL216-2 TaxID=3071453 RepID=UPI003D34F0B7
MGIFTGAYFDPSNQKHIMIVTDLLRGLITLCVTYLEMTNILSIQIMKRTNT